MGCFPYRGHTNQLTMWLLPPAGWLDTRNVFIEALAHTLLQAAAVANDQTNDA